MSQTGAPADPASGRRILGEAGEALRAMRDRLRGGDLGALPVVIGLAVIWAVFQLLNPNFLSTNNLVNLTLQCAATGTIAIGIVLVLLVAEIDLSVGSVSGLSAALLAVTYVQHGWSLFPAIVVAIGSGAAVGLLYSFLFSRFGVPSFVITLAGLLAVLGLQLWVLGRTGTVNLPFDSPIVQFAQHAFLPLWASCLLVGLAATALALQRWSRSQRRVRAGLSALSLSAILTPPAILAIGLGAVVWYLHQDRGVGYSFLLFILLVLGVQFMLERTRWGRSVYAVGGSVEAARRAGINVDRVYVTVFVACSTFAAIGGVLAAARLGAANQGTGGSDTNLNAIAAAVIGGTSLFGGRGAAWAALLGILVIQSISNGLTLLNLDSPVRYMITGAVLLAAVIVDSLSRRARKSRGRG